MTNPETDRRAQWASALWEAAEQNTIAEWICCDPIDPKHGLCVAGGKALEMLRALIVDDPEAYKPAPLTTVALELAAAVSVPPPAPRADDQAAVLREAAAAIEAEQAREEATEWAQYGELDHETEVQGGAVRHSAGLLRRLAAEAQRAKPDRCPHGCDISTCPCLACEADEEQQPEGPCVAGEQQNETPEAATVHAVPLPGSNGISSCCGRPPCEFVGERVTRDPDKVTCPGPTAGPRP